MTTTYPTTISTTYVPTTASSTTISAVPTTAAVLNPACTVSGNFDYIGNDLYTLGQVVNSLSECCDLCLKDAGCFAWTYLKYDAWTSGKCYLKSAAGEIFIDPNKGNAITSGTVRK